MAGRYVSIDTTELRRFIERLNQAGRGKEFEKELSRFLDAIAVEFLSYVQDFIIQAGSVDTRLLLNSFQKSGELNKCFYCPGRRSADRSRHQCGVCVFCE